MAEKSSIQIGHAVWVKENCVPLTDGVECGNCARHCPTGAIQMVASDPSNSESLKIPVVNTERCIGCGACENLARHVLLVRFMWKAMRRIVLSD